jgi:hypothetical protein
MNSLQIGLVIGFVLSVSLNGLFFWYLKKTTGRLLFISENLNDLISIIGVYRKHLKALYEMEMFYGDEVLQNLIDHTNSLYDMLEDYEDVVYLTEPLTFTENNEDDLNDNDEETDEREDLSEKDVLYAGSRRRNS